MGYPKDPELARPLRRAEYQRNRAAYLKRNAAYKKTLAGQAVDNAWRIKKRYKITREEWQALFDAQSGQCAICQRRPIKHTDHCHYTGFVRGLLCHHCNVGIGCFQDDPAMLEKAVAYLKAPQPRLR